PRIQISLKLLARPIERVAEVLFDDFFKWKSYITVFVFQEFSLRIPATLQRVFIKIKKQCVNFRRYFDKFITPAGKRAAVLSGSFCFRKNLHEIEPVQSLPDTNQIKLIRLKWRFFCRTKRVFYRFVS